MSIEEDKKELEYSEKKHSQEDYGLERLIGYLIGGIGFFFILLKVVNTY